MKQFSIVLLLSFFALAGCTSLISNNSSDNNSWNTTMTGDVQRIVGNTTCDNYLRTIQCFSQSMTWNDAMTFTSLYTSLLQSFKDVPNAQLEQTCTTLSSSLRTHPTLLQDYPNCNKL